MLSVLVSDFVLRVWSSVVHVLVRVLLLGVQLLPRWNDTIEIVPIGVFLLYDQSLTPNSVDAVCHSTHTHTHRVMQLLKNDIIHPYHTAIVLAAMWDNTFCCLRFCRLRLVRKLPNLPGLLLPSTWHHCCPATAEKTLGSWRRSSASMMHST